MNFFKRWIEKMTPPSSAKFFGQLKIQSEAVRGVAEMLSEAVRTRMVGTPEFSARIHAAENQVDKLTDAIRLSVRRTMIHPVDPDDLRDITNGLDSVVDTMDHFAWRIAAYRLTLSPPMEEMVRVIDEMTRELAVIFGLLAGGDTDGIPPRFDRLSALEKDADGIFHGAVKQLHAGGERYFTVEDEVMSILEMCTDQCEDVGEAVVVMLERNR